MKVVWSGSALQRVEEIYAHIRDENLYAARRVVREILLAGDSLKLFPFRGRPGLIAGTRELVAVAPYVLVYEVENGEVRILEVWHSAQDRSR